MNKLICYCDGSCPRPHEPGAWAFVILMDDDTTVSGAGRVNVATNNTMELQAALETMKRLLIDGHADRHVIIYSDSMYVVQGFQTWMHGWVSDDFRDKKNADIWRELYAMKKRFHRITLKWVKGHNGNYWNEFCDVLAGKTQKGRPRHR